MNLEGLVGPQNVLVFYKEEAAASSVLLGIGLGNLCCPSGEEHAPRLLSCFVEGWCSAVVEVDKSRESGFITTLM